MRNYRRALAKFWGSFYNRSTLLPAPVPIPAFQTGYAVIRDMRGNHQAPPFPYITYDIVRPSFTSSVMATASIWDRNIANWGFMGLVDDVLAQMTDSIPVDTGRFLCSTSEGLIWLYQSNPFIRYLDDPDDQAVSRGIVTVFVRGYLSK